MTHRRAAYVVTILVTGLALLAGCTTFPAHAGQGFLFDPDFWMSVAVNGMGTGLFLTRAFAPEASRGFAWGTQILGIPSLVLGVSDIIRGGVDLSTFGNLGYASWALGATLLDHVFRVEYRDPVRLEILIPYVATYYVAVGFQAAVLLDKDIVAWSIAGAACVINVAASFFARSRETF